MHDQCIKCKDGQQIIYLGEERFCKGYSVYDIEQTVIFRRISNSDKLKEKIPQQRGNNKKSFIYGSMPRLAQLLWKYQKNRIEVIFCCSKLIFIFYNEVICLIVFICGATLDPIMAIIIFKFTFYFLFYFCNSEI